MYFGISGFAWNLQPSGKQQHNLDIRFKTHTFNPLNQPIIQKLVTVKVKIYDIGFGVT